MSSLNPNPSGFHYEASGKGGSATAISFEWYTPPEVFAALGLTFDLDPASPGLDKCHVPALACYTKADNGLVKPWYGLVWCNPPYGGQTGRWMRRMARHGNGIMLICPRTDTTWWHDYASRAEVICFLAGRLAFYRDREHASKASTIANALLAYGEVASRAVESCGLGHVVYSAQRQHHPGEREREDDETLEQSGQHVEQ